MLRSKTLGHTNRKMFGNLTCMHNTPKHSKLDDTSRGVCKQEVGSLLDTMRSDGDDEAFVASSRSKLSLLVNWDQEVKKHQRHLLTTNYREKEGENLVC